MPSSSATRLAKAAGDFDAFLHRGIADRHERHHVRGADARVFAGMLVQIDRFGRRIGSPGKQLLLPPPGADIGDHGAVVVEVRMAIENLNPGHGLDSLDDLGR